MSENSNLAPDKDADRNESEDGFDSLVPLAVHGERSQRKLSIAMQDGIQRRRRSSVFNLNELTDPGGNNSAASPEAGAGLGAQRRTSNIAMAGGLALSRKKSIKIDPMANPGLVHRPSMTARPSMAGSALLDANPGLLSLERRRSSAVKMNTANDGTSQGGTKRKTSTFAFGPSTLPQIRQARFGEADEDEDEQEHNPLRRLSAISIADSKATAPPMIKEVSNEAAGSSLDLPGRVTLGVEQVSVYNPARRTSAVAFSSLSTPDEADSESDESEEATPPPKRDRSHSVYGGRRSLAKRRQSLARQSVSIIVTAEEKNQDENITEQKMCTFEVSSHTVSQLLKKIENFQKERPELETDLMELRTNIKELSNTTFLTRKQYEEDIINFHLAQKRLVYFPINFQSEVDQMALSIRQDNKSLLSKLKEEKDEIFSKLPACENQCDELLNKNRLLAKEKEISDKLMSALVTGLNQRMSTKAQTQIEVFKTLNQIGNNQKALDEIPERLEILTSNCDEAIEQCEVLIRLNKEKITEHGLKIHQTVEQIIELRTALAALTKLSKEHARVIAQGNTMQESRLAHIRNEVEIKTGIYSDKKEKYTAELEEKESEEEAARIAYEKYEKQIDSYNQEIENIETESIQVIKDRECENKSKFENLLAEDKYKQLMDQAELDKGNLNAKKSEIQRYVLEQRDKVDVQLNQREFNEMKSANADSASVVTKETLTNEYKKVQEQLLNVKSYNKNIFEKLYKVDRQLTELKNKTDTLITESKNRVNALVKETKERQEQAVQPKMFVTETREQIKNLRKLKDEKFVEFENNEKHLEEEIKFTKHSLKTNTEQIVELKKILKDKEPIYKKVIEEENRNNQVLNKMKSGYQIKEVKLKILNEQIDKFTHNRLELRKEFKKSHDERSQIMKETREIMKNYSAQITEFGRKTYSTIVEQEQFNFSNQTINNIKNNRIKYINSMSEADDKINDQVRLYKEQLEELTRQLSSARENFIKFGICSSNTSRSIYNHFTDFFTETTERTVVVGQITSGLSVVFGKLQFYKDQITKLQNESKMNKKGAGDQKTEKTEKHKIKKSDLIAKNDIRRMAVYN